ncbi:MAG: DegT/DnrJ/EryC1/StrS family aminotransferase [Humidesulfovibrio sp.]|uniref:DegT/DnrJ/EryC1/StrS family aminotransferase n=1 Tax=Humidesulfovibrio sp. TaxID=2910988 RepID=UPI00273626D8|nr:DegT/DnrJ/EryC1/StrS family aminotransferase [Humidesulfovibrio sp.]MDP2848330.1 DegT/DnrJ/EryC1/StrS family aminotransferase [Humidesulfovibrio sp.]
MTEKLAIHGGAPVRETPMPNRLAFGPEEQQALLQAVEHYASKGQDPPYQGHFEESFCRAFCDFMGGGRADAVSSGTASVFVALAALGLPKGSHVLISPVTDSGPLNCIIMQGLVPVLVDSRPGSYNVGLEQVLARVTPQTSAFLAVHSAGEPLEIAAITEALHQRGIKVLEDCSQAPGATQGGRLVGTVGDIAAFSTMYRKTLTAGASGGLVYTQNEELFRMVQAHADRGKQSWRNDLDGRDPGHCLFPALNFNTDELSCAIGIASLGRLPDSVRQRVEFLEALVARLPEESELCRPYALHKGFSPFYFPIFVDADRLSCSKTEFAKAVAAEGIGLGEHYGCVVHSWQWAQPYFSDDFVTRNALDTRDRSFNLYVNERYGQQEVEDIVRAIAKVERWFRK